MNGIDRRRVDCLFQAGGPANRDGVNLRAFTQAEVQAALVLCGVTARSHDLLQLLLPFPTDTNLRTERAPIAGIAFELK